MHLMSQTTLTTFLQTVNFKYFYHVIT